MPVTVDPPKHPLPALTTYERLQAKLDEVLAEQDQRARIAASR